MCISLPCSHMAINDGYLIRWPFLLMKILKLVFDSIFKIKKPTYMFVCRLCSSPERNRTAIKGTGNLRFIH